MWRGVARCAAIEQHRARLKCALKISPISPYTSPISPYISPTSPYISPISPCISPISRLECALKFEATYVKDVVDGDLRNMGEMWERYGGDMGEIYGK